MCHDRERWITSSSRVVPSRGRSGSMPTYARFLPKQGRHYNRVIRDMVQAAILP